MWRLVSERGVGNQESGIRSQEFGVWDPCPPARTCDVDAIVLNRSWSDGVPDS